jgi:hypothetical protein
MLMPGIISIIVTLVVIGLVLYLINMIPMDNTIKQIIHAIIVVLVVVWLLQAFGLIGSIHNLIHPAQPIR